jgi:vacuolar protein 8
MISQEPGRLTCTTAENKVLIVQLGGLQPLIRQMLSPNVEVQCNAVGCITNLATHEENKAKIARSGALGPLTRLAKSRDMRVQRNATGALLNMTHSGEQFQVAITEALLLTQLQTKIDSNLSTPAPFQFWSSCCLPQMLTFSTTAQLP